MLRTLSIRNIVLIESLDLEFEDGLTVLTGETGAGKSILLDALGLALGLKGRRDLVRDRMTEGSVTAVFEPAATSTIHRTVAELGLEASEDGEVILRRTVSSDGRARAFVNDRRVSAQVMAEIGARLVEIHGQHDDSGLLNPRGHRRLLDGFAAHEALLRDVGAAWSAWQALARDLADREAAHQQAAADADFLRHSVEELDTLSPRPDEDAELDTERRLVRRSAKMIEEMAAAAHALGGTGAEGELAKALSRLTHAAEDAEGRLEPTIAAIDRTMTELSDAQAALEAAIDALTFDPERLETIEERLFEIRRLARKHSIHPDGLADLTETLRTRLRAVDGHDAQIAALTQQVDTAAKAYRSAAEDLRASRIAAAAALDQLVTSELGPLRMENAVFRTDVTPAEPGAAGIDAVRFAARINPGAPEGPIDEIASGGELSRFLLALRVQLAGSANASTLVFDEIDRGIGGATANAVGSRLARLGAGAQVLVVTHSPQVAAKGTHHFRISKDLADGQARTSVAPLAPEDRVLEIARMLAGESVTDEARSAARALMSAPE